MSLSPRNQEGQSQISI